LFHFLSHFSSFLLIRLPSFVIVLSYPFSLLHA